MVNNCSIRIYLFGFSLLICEKRRVYIYGLVLRNRAYIYLLILYFHFPADLNLSLLWGRRWRAPAAVPVSPEGVVEETADRYWLRWTGVGRSCSRIIYKFDFETY